MNLQIPECKKDKKRIVLVLAVTMIICLLLQGCEKKKNMTEYERYVEKTEKILADVLGAEEMSDDKYNNLKERKMLEPSDIHPPIGASVYIRYRAAEIEELGKEYDGKLVNQFYFTNGSGFSLDILIQEFSDSEMPLERLRKEQERHRNSYNYRTDIDGKGSNLEAGYSEDDNSVQIYFHYFDKDDETYIIRKCVDNMYIYVGYSGYKNTAHHSDVICVLERMGLGTPDELEMVGGWTGRRF